MSGVLFRKTGVVGQVLMTGGEVVNISTVKVQLFVLPLASVVRQVTVVRPAPKVLGIAIVLG